jgi:hypothetical protein
MIAPGITIEDVLPGGLQPQSARMPALAKKFRSAYKGMLEAALDMTVDFIDPDERWIDPETGERWHEIGGLNDPEGRSSPLTDQERLRLARVLGRRLATNNEYAINGHENRVNYIVGSGHIYTAVAKDPPAIETKEAEGDAAKAASDKRVEEVQAVIDDFVETNKWHARQQEIVLRKDRDGECFLRFFATQVDPEAEDASRGTILVRFIEPEQVKTPANQQQNPAASLGILTEAKDVETVLAYFVDGETVDAKEIQHRKANVDFNVKRGMPLFYPCARDLSRADTIQRNMAVMSTIQSAIAMVRKHTEATGSAIAELVQNMADVQTRNPYTQATQYHKRYAAGTILDATQGMEYEFPSNVVRPDAFVAVRDAILRSVAARLVMPEFMLTSDASNANYSSTMVAEGPAVKHFSRLQWAVIEEDREVLERVLDVAVETGRISQETRDAVEIDVQPPRLETRDRGEDTEADMKLVQNKVMSKHTAAIRQDLDPEREKELIAQEREESDPFGGMENNPLFQQAAKGFQPGQQPNQQGDQGDGKGGN